MSEVESVVKVHRMDSEIKKRWVARLRSGNDVQGKGCLRAQFANGDVNMCCLGVLTDMYIQSDANKSKEGWEICSQVPTKTRFSFVSEDAILPARVKDWSNFSGGVGPVLRISGDTRKEYKLPQEVMTLPQLNDYGVPFSVIADIIEEQL